MLIRSRSARMAGIALAAVTPFTLAATPAFADGDEAEVGATVSAGNVHVTSTKGLSRTTVVLCGGETVVVPSWAGETLEGDVPVEGIVQAVFQHSGNNTTDAAEDLLADLAGADAVSGESTGAVAFYDEDGCDEPGDDGDDGDDGGNRDDNGDGEEVPPVTVTDPAPPTSGDPAPSTPNPSPPADPAPAVVLPITAQPAAEIPTLVLGETLVAGGELPRTGAGDAQPLMLVALSLVGTGLALRAGSRRIRSVSISG